MTGKNHYKIQAERERLKTQESSYYQNRILSLTYIN